jgi:predicted ArsR family transcriptional regulator
MKTSRQQLLEYVQLHEVATAEELSRTFHMTQANARHHLDILQNQNLVEVIGLRPSHKKGRPAKLFGPSKKLLGDNLDLLSSILLQEISLISTYRSKESILRHISEKLLICISSQIYNSQSEMDTRKNHSNYGETVDIEKVNLPVRTRKLISKSLTQRLYHTIQILNKLHYHARWEAHADSPRLILGFCPYHRVQARHPELCQVDAFMLEELLQAQVEQIARLVKERNDLTSCIFKVHNR